jgi:hypothetical protein
MLQYPALFNCCTLGLDLHTTRLDQPPLLAPLDGHCSLLFGATWRVRHWHSSHCQRTFELASTHLPAHNYHYCY